jgi:hypothetical protein
MGFVAKQRNAAPWVGFGHQLALLGFVLWYLFFSGYVKIMQAFLMRDPGGFAKQECWKSAVSQ